MRYFGLAQGRDPQDLPLERHNCAVEAGQKRRHIGAGVAPADGLTGACGRGRRLWQQH